MGHARCDRTTAKPESFDNSHADLAGVFVTFDCCDLLIGSIRFKYFPALFFCIANFLLDIFCYDLSFQHLKDMYLSFSPRKAEIRFPESQKMYCIFELRITWADLNFFILDDLFAPMVHFQDIHIT